MLLLGTLIAVGLVLLYASNRAPRATVQPSPLPITDYAVQEELMHLMIAQHYTENEMQEVIEKNFDHAA